MATSYFTQNTSASTLFKNSGILRYHFGFTGGSGNPNALPALTGTSLQGGNTYVAFCLGPDSVTTPDSDGQLFGMTPGYAAVGAGGVFGLFANLPVINGTGGGLVVANNSVQGPGAGIRFPPNAVGAGTATGQARFKANGRIPPGTKVFAWFVMDQQNSAGSTVADEQPLPLVQTDVQQNTVYSGGAAVSGESWLSRIRVAVSNAGAVQSDMGGTLYVKLQHSILDIPGLNTQSAAPAFGAS